MEDETWESKMDGWEEGEGEACVCLRGPEPGTGSRRLLQTGGTSSSRCDLRVRVPAEYHRTLDKQVAQVSHCGLLLAKDSGLAARPA